MECRFSTCQFSTVESRARTLPVTGGATQASCLVRMRLIPGRTDEKPVVGVLTRRTFLGFGAVVPFTGRLKAQQSPTYSSDVSVVNVLATVRDKKGKIVSDLKQDDFRLEDEGHPQSIRYFARETGLPLTLGLLVDTSMSQRRVLPQERSASYRFLDQVLRPDKDQAFILHFDHEAELLADLTSSRQKLQNALGMLELPQQDQRQASRGSGRRISARR